MYCFFPIKQLQNEGEHLWFERDCRGKCSKSTTSLEVEKKKEFQKVIWRINDTFWHFDILTFWHVVWMIFVITLWITSGHFCHRLLWLFNPMLFWQQKSSNCTLINPICVYLYLHHLKINFLSIKSGVLYNCFSYLSKNPFYRSLFEGRAG